MKRISAAKAWKVVRDFWISLGHSHVPCLLEFKSLVPCKFQEPNLHWMTMAVLLLWSTKEEPLHTTNHNKAGMSKMPNQATENCIKINVHVIQTDKFVDLHFACSISPKKIKRWCQQVNYSLWIILSALIRIWKQFNALTLLLTLLCSLPSIQLL